MALESKVSNENLIRRPLGNTLYQIFGEALVVPAAAIAGSACFLEFTSKLTGTGYSHMSPDEAYGYKLLAGALWAVWSVHNIYQKRERIFYEKEFIGPKIPHAYLLIRQLTESTSNDKSDTTYQPKSNF